MPNIKAKSIKAYMPSKHLYFHDSHFMLLQIFLTGHWFGRPKQKQGGIAFSTVYNVVLKPLSLSGLDAAYN